MWYDYARWQADSGGGVGAATACLQRAVHALPNCLLLFFALADLHEAQGDVAAAKQVGLCGWGARILGCSECGVCRVGAVLWFDLQKWTCLLKRCVVSSSVAQATNSKLCGASCSRVPPCGAWQNICTAQHEFAPHLLAHLATSKPCASHSATAHPPFAFQSFVSSLLSSR